MMDPKLRIDTIPACAGCRQERAAFLALRPYPPNVAHDERCACHVIVPTRPHASSIHVHLTCEQRPWLYGARGGAYDVKPPPRRSRPRSK